MSVKSQWEFCSSYTLLILFSFRFRQNGNYISLSLSKITTETLFIFSSFVLFSIVICSNYLWPKDRNNKMCPPVLFLDVITRNENPQNFSLSFFYSLRYLSPSVSVCWKVLGFKSPVVKWKSKSCSAESQEWSGITLQTYIFLFGFWKCSILLPQNRGCKWFLIMGQFSVAVPFSVISNVCSICV